jgi:hypothetical protein
VLGLVVVLVAFAFIPSALHATAASTTPCVPGDCAGEAGTVTGLAATPSQETIQEPNSGPFNGLSVTINQTQNLVNQDVSVSWTNGTQTINGSPGDFNGDYLQMFECWGDPETTYPDDSSDPGPPPSQCEFGGESSTPATSYPIQSSAVGFEYSRRLSQSSWDGYSDLENCSTNESTPGSTCQYPGYDNLYTDTTDGYVIEPFAAVDGTVVDQQADYNYDVNPAAPQSFWDNPYFSFDTTNEVDFAQTYSDGDGDQQFQVDTGLEAPGLGCGQDIEPTAGGGTTTPQCWLVVVPRGTPAQENASENPQAVVTSPLTPQAWANRIAFPLQFNPVGSSCSLNAATEGIEGSELASEAVASWEPALCGQSSTTSYSYLENTDDQARENLTDPTYGSVGMSVFSDPIDPSQTSPTNPVVYAPLTLSGVVIGFNIERVPGTNSQGEPDDDENSISGTRIADLNLTPRLVAKLLTESYQGQFEELSADKPGPSYDWVDKNPDNLFTDPDFLQYNPEFQDLSAEEQVDAGTLLVEEAGSDAASTLWQWVLSDPSAKAWLAGNPDPLTGMCVNPNYVTASDSVCYPHTPAAFGTPTPENFPKSDPYCESLSGAAEPPIVTGTGASQVSTPARPLCILDWSPYATSMKAAAQDASEANDQAKTTYSPTATSAQSAWSSNGPQIPGTYLVMTVTDSPSADLYGLQAASLSRAGDDGTPTTLPVFVPPTTTDLLAGEQAMSPSSVTGVLQPNVSTTAANAYPLTMLTYAAATPETLSTGDRSKYAAFIRYAVQAGQVNGEQPGQLPEGYVPLPSNLQSEALTAANTILNPPNESTPASQSTAAPTSSVLPDTFPSTVGPPSTAAAASPTTSGARRHPLRPLGPAALTSLRSHGFPIGMLRWILPLALFIGLLAGLASWFMGRLGRRLNTARAPKTSKAKVPVIYQPSSSNQIRPKSLFRSQPKVRGPK